ncbi:MAG: hypothetical protein ABFS32_12825 [Bacteroidota bacterium]
MKTIQFLIILYLSISCNNETKDPCQFNGCNSQRQTIKVASNAKGRISTLSQQYPDLWVIVSEEGIIGEESITFDGPDIIIVCNINDSLKVLGQKVIFSGELKDSCNDFEKGVSEIYYCTPKQILLSN